ncbi:FBP C-terminal treble-clef zinc-finger [Clostridium cavendishii DSM 21758]|uniref:FBP C-terminal treble-clef zinc-finger n=1 Tax=Clostridium cavendishii DSM 21758 TaxID=1121302 RepID=A0A1M6G728_9CLOT|nr:FusB/FusC family EF-G-binding protein [Clostridium cavendishii]SHJ05745.1 FBP C-terminal treble-clef zinc-finger [Clostridium cavendishii DSM 21758]
MNTFIKKHEYNYIKKCLNDLNNAFTNCVDANVVLATKAYIQKKILSIFTNLSEEEKELLNISKITDRLHIDIYLANLDQYVYGMPNITTAQINKLFKKEKKFKLPDISEENSKNVYLGWIDDTIKKLFIVYNLNGTFVGMACRIPTYGTNNTHVCALCNRVGRENEVTFVSPICKTSNTSKNAYKSIGFNICLDSKKCNERIVSTEKLEELLKDVNNIK